MLDRITAIAATRTSTPYSFAWDTPASTNGRHWLFARAYDPVAWDSVGVVKVDFHVNGARKCTDNAAPFTCSFGVGSAVGVAHKIYAAARDISGNSGVSQVITVTSR